MVFGRFKCTSLAIMALVCLSLSVLAQTAAPARAPRSQSPATAQNAKSLLSVSDVIKMSKAGLSDDIIIQQVKKRPQPFDLSPDQLIELKTASVSERVMQVMLDLSKADAPAPSMLNAPAPIPASESLPPAPASAFPTELGVYAKKKGEWTEVLPEIVNWKSGGAAKHIATVGIVKGDLNGHVMGTASRNTLTTPIEFLIVAPDGVAITEYQLLRLRRSGDDREFRTMTGGVLHQSGGATRDFIPFDGKKLAPHVFTVLFPGNLGAGEYGFLPPGATGTAAGGKIYSFRVME